MATVEHIVFKIVFNFAAMTTKILSCIMHYCDLKVDNYVVKDAGIICSIKH